MSQVEPWPITWALPYSTIFCHTLPYSTILYHTLPYSVIFCLALTPNGQWFVATFCQNPQLLPFSQNQNFLSIERHGIFTDPSYLRPHTAGNTETGCMLPWWIVLMLGQTLGSSSTPHTLPKASVMAFLLSEPQLPFQCTKPLYWKEVVVLSKMKRHGAVSWQSLMLRPTTAMAVTVLEKRTLGSCYHAELFLCEQSSSSSTPYAHMCSRQWTS